MSKKPRSEKRRRTHIVGVRVTEEEFARLREEADDCEVTVAEMMRRPFLGPEYPPGFVRKSMRPVDAR